MYEYLTLNLKQLKSFFQQHVNLKETLFKLLKKNIKKKKIKKKFIKLILI